VISGQIDMMFADLASEVPHVQSLKLRILAVAASARSAAAPDVPTMVEAGVKNCEVDPWYGIVAPAGTPRDILAKLHGAIVAGLKSPDMRQRLDGLGYVVVGSSQEQFSIQLKVDIEKFARLIKNAGIKAGY
jgi:tripartite-type tricarboxylate transporter receptor subunit TctC